jgi:hypothetical protein
MHPVSNVKIVDERRITGLGIGALAALTLSGLLLLAMSLRIGFDPSSWMAARLFDRFLAALGLGGAVGAAFALSADMIRQAMR